MNVNSARFLIDHSLPEHRTVMAGLALDVLTMAAAASFIALAAQVRIPLSFTPVPVTGQTLAVLVAGMALGTRRGGAAVLLYLLAGGLGLPVFAGFGFGAAHLAGPTGGYLLGFIPAAWLCGFLAEKGWDRQLIGSLGAMLLGSIVIYAAGATWLGFYVGFGRALSLGVLPFIPGDMLKIAGGATVLPLAWKLVQGRDRI